MLGILSFPLDAAGSLGLWSSFALSLLSVKGDSGSRGDSGATGDSGTAGDLDFPSGSIGISTRPRKVPGFVAVVCPDAVTGTA